MSQRKQSKNQNNPRKAGKRKTNANMNGYDGSLSISNNFQKIPRQVGLILPDRYRTTLRFWKQFTMNFAANFSLAARFRPSSAFDVDPLIASTAMSGFVELAALYNTYRVLSSNIRCRFVSTMTAQPVTVSVTPVNIDPSGTPSGPYIIALREQPYSRFQTTGLAGAPVTDIFNQMSTEKIYGSKAAIFDDAFSSPTTTSPTNNWFWVISGIVTAFDANLMYVTTTIEVDVEFYDRAFLQN